MCWSGVLCLCWYQTHVRSTEIEIALECPTQRSRVQVFCRRARQRVEGELAVNREKLPKRGDPSESEKIFRAGKWTQNTARYTRLIALLCCVSPLISLLSTSRSVFDVSFFSASREFLSWVSNEIAERSLRSLSPVTRKFIFFVFYHNKQRKIRLIRLERKVFLRETQKSTRIEW